MCGFLTMIGVVFLMCGCASDPVVQADVLAQRAGLHRGQIQTSVFLLTTYTKITDTTKPFNIYIEGDGLAWRSLWEPSQNPTPRKALGLSLAALDGAANVIYIARPCQYTPLDLDRNCKVTYWTQRRFSEEVIESVHQAIDKLTGTAKKNELHLIGYSGGGAVAVLVAARRDDVRSIRTLAGNLDHAEVNRQHDVTLLTGSLNAIEVARKVATIPQIHFNGSDDDVITPSIAERFYAAAMPTSCIKLHTIDNVTHERGWAEHWTALLKMNPICSHARSRARGVGS